MSVFRLSGKAFGVGERPWSTKDGSRSGTMPVATIRVNDFVVTEIVLGDAVKEQVKEGADVDLIVDVTASGGYLRSQAIGVWPTPSAHRAA